MSVKEETAKGVLWGLLKRIALSPAQFIFGIILARLLSPGEMGIMGLTAIFFAVAGQLQDAGFGSALIRKQDRTDVDINTVFWFNVSMSFLLSGSLFAAAPWFASFFNQPALLNLTRVAAVMMFLKTTSNIHWTLLTAKRDFKTQSIIVIIANLVPMPFTIWAAFAGWSYWALMLHAILNDTLSIALLWYISPWKPRFVFSWDSLREFFGFSSRLTLSGLIGTICSNLQSFVIGKFYSPADLGLFSRGQAATNLPIKISQSLLGEITFPILATLQHDKENLIRTYRQYTRLSSLVVIWCMLTMAANCHHLIYILYGEAWLPAADFAKLLCISVMFGPLSAINGNLYAVLGRSDISLRRSIIINVFNITALFIGASHSVMGVCMAAMLTGWMTFSVSIYLTSKICPLRMRYQLADVFPYICISGVANIPSLLISQMDWNPLLSLLLGGTSAFILYALMLAVRKDPTSLYLYSYAQNKIQSRFGRKTPEVPQS